MNYFFKVFFIIGRKKNLFLILTTLFILTTFFETISLAIIAPYLGVILKNSSNVNEDSFLMNIISNFKFYENFELTFSIIVILIFLIKLIVSLFNIYLLNFLTWKQIIILREKLLTSFKNMNYSIYINKRSSEYINQVEVLTKVFVKQTFFPLIKMSSDLILLISILVLLAYINFALLILNIIIFSIFLFSYDFIFKKRSKKYGFQLNKELENIFKNINDLFYGFKEIKILNKLDFFINRIIKLTTDIASKQVRLKLISDSPRYIYEFLIALLIVVFVIYYNIFLSNNLFDLIPTITVFIAAFYRIIPIISGLNYNLTLLRSAMVSNDKIFEQLKLSDENIILSNNKVNIKSFESLIFENVTFAYEKEKILKNINFEIHSGEMIGIIGKSGSGKSTLIDLILGLLQPKSGKIYLNKKLIDYTNKSKVNPIQGLSCYLPQENFIIDDNAFRNIAMSEIIQPNVERKIKEISKKLDLNINLAKNLGDRGKNISGGQRQRVSLARALFHKKEILILDESTSALDKKIENEILDYLNSIKSTCTIIIVSHSIDSLRYCDRVYEISNSTMRSEIQ